MPLDPASLAASPACSAAYAFSSRSAAAGNFGPLQSKKSRPRAQKTRASLHGSAAAPETIVRGAVVRAWYAAEKRKRPWLVRVAAARAGERIESALRRRASANSRTHAPQTLEARICRAR